jgi:hypothetical protein
MAGTKIKDRKDIEFIIVKLKHLEVLWVTYSGKEIDFDTDRQIIITRDMQLYEPMYLNKDYVKAGLEANVWNKYEGPVDEYQHMDPIEKIFEEQCQELEAEEKLKNEICKVYGDGPNNIS